MLKLRIRVQDEDKFGLVVHLLSQQLHSNLYSITNLDINSDKDNIYFLLEYSHPKFINRLLIKIKDLIEVIGFQVEYAFVYSKEEAYTDIDTITNRNIIYNELKY